MISSQMESLTRRQALGVDSFASISCFSESFVYRFENRRHFSHCYAQATLTVFIELDRVSTTRSAFYPIDKHI